MRLARLCALAALCGAPAACKKSAPPHTVGLALDVGGRGDQSFNDGTLRGLEMMAAGLRYTPRGYEPIPDAEYQKLLGPLALPHLAIPRPIVLQGKAQEDYEPNLRLLVDQGAELVVAVGFRMEAATRRVARDNPRAKFLLIDSPVLDDSGKPITLPNVRAVVFREHEGSFLAGALAGELTRTGKVGFVGGMQLPPLPKFQVGFRAGGGMVNPPAAPGRPGRRPQGTRGPGGERCSREARGPPPRRRSSRASIRRHPKRWDFCECVGLELARLTKRL